MQWVYGSIMIHQSGDGLLKFDSYRTDSELRVMWSLSGSPLDLKSLKPNDYRYQIEIDSTDSTDSKLAGHLISFQN